MKILFVIESLDPSLGGPSVSAPSTAAAIASVGNEVVIAYQEQIGKPLDKDLLVDTIPNFKLVKCIALPLARGSSSGAKELGELVREADFLHLQGMWRPILYRAASIARKASIPYALSPRGMLDPWSLAQKGYKKRIALKLCWRKILNDAEFIHALNKDEARLLQPLNLKARVEIMPNGIFQKTYARLPAQGEFYANNPAINSRPYILFLGRLHYKKGLDYLIDAYSIFCKSNSSVDLVIAGPDDGLLAKVMSRVDSLGLGNRVHIMGPLYGVEKLKVYVDASCFCLPSRQEGFSMAITEAMACHLPVVISNRCNFPEVGEAGVGIVVDLKPAEIAKGLLWMFEDEDRAKSLGRKASNFVAERYTWEQIALDLVDAYRK